MSETSSRPSSERPPGTRVGRYVIVSRLGQGGMGSVHLADDPKLDRRVAIKLCREPLAGLREHPRDGAVVGCFSRTHC